MSKLVECVLNFSEGSDESLIDELVSAVRSAKVLDVHSDVDHNRSVVTMIGEPAAIKKAAFELTERAMQLLEINEHDGVHPFIGVVDVIPFIPIKNCTMAEVRSLAHELGKELWEKLKLPVYYYGEAALIKERADLSFVRRGGYRVLRDEIGKRERQPDVGNGLHPNAGAVAVGARNFLIAFNVNLDTTDVDLAKSIAKNIREKSGGLIGVRALGVYLESRKLSQVTINICDHEKSSLKAVFDEVSKWAHEYDVDIIESEIVGLVPQSAIFEGMKEYLKLPSFPDTKILKI